MTDITIPPAALEAGARKLCEIDDWHWSWETVEDVDRETYRENARAAFLAIVQAWPGMVERRSWDGSLGRLILPLTENHNG